MRLPPEHHDALMAQVAGGKSLTECADWLLASHGISISKQALSKIVARHRSARADVAKVVARTHIEKSLPGDLEYFDERLEALGKVLESLEQSVLAPDASNALIDSYLKTLAEWRKWDESKKKALGLDQPDERFDGLGEILLAIRSRKLDQ